MDGCGTERRCGDIVQVLWMKRRGIYQKNLNKTKKKPGYDSLLSILIYIYLCFTLMISIILRYVSEFTMYIIMFILLFVFIDNTRSYDVMTDI